MLNGKNSGSVEDEAKKKFIDETAQMKLLIVVDKLLTGFDAPLPPISISTRACKTTGCSKPSAV